VAAHSQSNEGDVSPNTKGPICIDTGKPCDYKTSTCNGRVSYSNCCSYLDIELICSVIHTVLYSKIFGGKSVANSLC